MFPSILLSASPSIPLSALLNTSISACLTHSLTHSLLTYLPTPGTSDPYVKFKCPPFKYRSAVIHRNLNPEWKEHFSFRTQSLYTSMRVRVFDHDYGSLDDYMGGQTVDLYSYALEE